MRLLSLLFLLLLMASCFDSSDSDELTQRPLTVVVDAVLKEPGSRVAGDDDDGDGGIDRYSTPRNFTVAIKSLSFIHKNGTRLNVISGNETLAESEVLELSQAQQIQMDSALTGKYVTVQAEFYYYDIEMELNQPDNFETLRLYLSDDDFASEGMLGHHQGDILLLDNASQEFQWVGAGEEWTQGSLYVTRPTEIGGAASDDPETGHDRGLFGNDDLWNSRDFMQGEQRDIYPFEAPLNLTVPETGGQLKITFDLTDSWYYEDFDGNQVFNPCIGNVGEEDVDGCSENAEWHPEFPTPIFTFVN